VRRPSFWRKFLVYLAALFFAFEAAASVYMLTASVRYRNDKVKEYDQYYQYLCDMLRNKVRYCYYDTNLNPLKNEVKYILCTLYERYGVSSRFFINNEPVADSSATYFLIDSNCVMVDLQKAGTPFSTYYVMGDYSDTNKSVEQLEKYLAADDDNVRIVVKDAYVNAYLYEFIPKEFEVVSYNRKGPDDKYGGVYQLLENINVNAEFNDIYHTYKRYTFASRTGYLECPEFVRAGDSGQSKEFEITGNSSDITVIVDRMTELYNYSDKQYYNLTHLVSTEYVPPEYLDDNRGTVISIFAGASLAALIISAVAAYIRYSKDRSTYEIIEYRRKTTNAMAHDLKTPLAAISAYAENLERDINTDKREYYSSRIVENVGVMNRMIEGILSFSKSEARSKVELCDKVSVSELIGEVLSETEPLFDREEIRLDIQNTGDIELKTDRELFKQALLNLITNAVKYSVKDKDVTVIIDKGYVSVSNCTNQVIDNVARLKEPFVKGHDARGDAGGAGLGLAIADNDLKLLGYKLELACEDGIFEARIVF